MKTKSSLFLSALAFTWLVLIPGVRAQTGATVISLHHFGGGDDGKSPSGTIVRDADGNFYGTTQLGGHYQSGEVYAITSAGKLTTLHSFYSGEGYAPIAGAIRGSNGKLYVTAPKGGYRPGGSLFEVTADGKYSYLHFFYMDTAAGLAPVGGVIQGRDGNLYGAARDGGAHKTGTIYGCTLAGEFAALYSFSALDGSSRNADGAHPLASLLEDGQGDLYGVAELGGASGGGTVFRFSPASGAFVTLHSFNALDSNLANNGGGYPSSALIRGGDGDFYGVTQFGGVNGNGTIFRITPDGTLTTMHGFGATGTNDSNGDGIYPQASLLLGSDGNFYGTASRGGMNGVGTVFKMTPAGKFTTLYSFKSSDAQPGELQGAYPASPLIQDSVGKFYGTVSEGALFRLVTAEPTIYSPLTAITTAGHPFSYKINATSTPTGYNATGLPEGLSVDTATGFITGTPTGEGTFAVTIQAGNADGVDSAPLTLTVRANVAPVITSAAEADGVADQPFSYQITADNFPTRFGAVGLPGGLKVDAGTGLISGSPDRAGTFHLMLSASNAAGVGTAPLTLTVKLEAPVITSAPTASGTVGNAFSYQITASGKAERFGVLRLPQGLSVDGSTGLISGTPQGKGKFTLTLQAFNAAGKGTQSLSLSVDEKKPVITSAPTASGTVGNAFSYQITASNGPQKYSVLGLPTGLRVDGNTGLISGKPTTSGTYRLTLEAINAAGTGQQTLTLKVQPN